MEMLTANQSKTYGVSRTAYETEVRRIPGKLKPNLPPLVPEAKVR